LDVLRTFPLLLRSSGVWIPKTQDSGCDFKRTLNPQKDSGIQRLTLRLSARLLFQHRAENPYNKNEANAMIVKQKLATEDANTMHENKQQHLLENDGEDGHATETVTEIVIEIATATVVENLNMMMFGMALGSTIVTAINGTSNKRNDGTIGGMQSGNLEFFKDHVLT